MPPTIPSLSGVAEQAPDDPLLAQSDSLFDKALAILGVVAVMVIAVGISIVRKSRKA